MKRYYFGTWANEWRVGILWMPAAAALARVRGYPLKGCVIIEVYKPR
jgi:hypothetical protein